jgi:Condensation domain/AMP-binding enzyme
METVSQAALNARLKEASATAFDLSRDPPFRAWLFQRDEHCHVLLLLMHHIASDGRSIGPLTRDLCLAYAARSCGAEPDFPNQPAVQYADYTLWQRQLLGEQEDQRSLLAQQADYWRRMLAGAPEELRLPVDHRRPLASSHRGGTVPLDLDMSLHRRLLALAHASGTTHFMVLQAGLAALLSRLGAGDDIPIGSPIAGRQDQALEDLVGFFVNTLVLRTDVSGNPSFRKLLARVREFDLAAYEHQDLPFNRLGEALQPTRSPARNPLFQVMLVLQNDLGAELTLPGLQVSVEELSNDIARFDLTFNFQERWGADRTAQGVVGTLEYSLDLFEQSTAQDLGARLVRLLEAAVEHPDVPLHQLNWLGDQERQTLLEADNATNQPIPNTSLPELFEAQVHRTPEAPALVFGQDTLSYAELNRRANRLAHWLIRQGVGPERLVGIAIAAAGSSPATRTAANASPRSSRPPCCRSATAATPVANST